MVVSTTLEKALLLLEEMPSAWKEELHDSIQRRSGTWVASFAYWSGLQAAVAADAHFEIYHLVRLRVIVMVSAFLGSFGACVHLSSD